MRMILSGSTGWQVLLGIFLGDSNLLGDFVGEPITGSGMFASQDVVYWAEFT